MIAAFVSSHKNTISANDIYKLYESVLKKHSVSHKLIPVSDGGNDFLYAYQHHFKCKENTLKLSSKYHTSIQNIPYLSYIEKRKKVAVLESSFFLGTKFWGTKFPRNCAHSGGLGEALNELNKIGFGHFVIGLGGGVTSDAGLACLQELGLKIECVDGEFLTSSNFSIQRLNSISKIYWENKNFFNKNSVVLICDADVTFFGKNGQPKAFGKQKNLTDAEIKIYDNALQRISSIYDFKQKPNLPYWGANGGLAGSFAMFARANIVKGSEFFLNMVDKNIFNEKTVPIVTEGICDFSSFKGKLTGTIVSKFSNNQVVGFFGKINFGREKFKKVYEISPNLVETNIENIKQSFTIKFEQFVIKYEKNKIPK